MKIFVVNLDKAPDRWVHYKDDEKYTRWSATHYDDLCDNHPIFENMVSMWNIDPNEHNAKCGCYISHTRLYQYIVTNKINDVLILEDDAYLINDIPDTKDLPQDGFTYLGGLSYNKKLTDGPLKVEFENGINKIDHKKYRMLMTVAIYIPHHRYAQKMLDSCTKRGRPRAIDTMILHSHCSQYVSYPASFLERPEPSQIRKSKTKFSNSHYDRVTGKNIIEEMENK